MKAFPMSWSQWLTFKLFYMVRFFLIRVVKTLYSIGNPCFDLARFLVFCADEAGHREADIKAYGVYYGELTRLYASSGQNVSFTFEQVRSLFKVPPDFNINCNSRASNYLNWPSVIKPLTWPRSSSFSPKWLNKAKRWPKTSSKWVSVHDTAFHKPSKSLTNMDWIGFHVKLIHCSIVFEVSKNSKLSEFNCFRM